MKPDSARPGAASRSAAIRKNALKALRPGENGSFNPMQIEAETGTTVLTFRPALRPDILQGLRA